MFAFSLANGTLETDLLGDIDYRPHLVEFGSELEMVFSIFLNVLEVDHEGRPLNEAHAARRAAEWIRQYNDPSYSPDEPLQEWECELQ